MYGGEFVHVRAHVAGGIQAEWERWRWYIFYGCFVNTAKGSSNQEKDVSYPFPVRFIKFIRELFYDESEMIAYLKQKDRKQNKTKKLI